MQARQGGQVDPTSFTRLLRNSVLALLAGGTAALFAYCLHSWDREEREVRDHLLVHSRFLAAVSGSYFENLGNSLSPLGQLLDKSGVLENPGNVRNLLTEFQHQHPGIASMAVFAPSGELLIGTAAKPGDMPPDYRDNPSHAARLMGDMESKDPYIVGAPEIDQVVRRWHFDILHVVRDKEGRPRFLVEATIPLEREDGFLQQYPMPANSHIGLFRSDGFLQARWPVEVDTSDLYGQVSASPVAQAVRIAPDTRSGFVQNRSLWLGNKDHRVAAFTRLDRGDMFAYVSVPWGHVWQQWWTHNAAVLIVSLLFLMATSGVAHRIWQREKLHRDELVSQARRDALTSLPNRAAAEEMVQFCIGMSQAKGDKFSILFVDIDRFKDINNSLGHALGDRLLVAIAGVLGKALGGDGKLCRLGGDEFLAVLPALDLDAAMSVAERLIGAFQQPVRVAEHSLQVTPSVGIAQFPEHGEDIDTLLKHADTAMYEAKRQGRNRFSVYMDELGERALARVEMEQLLHEALCKNQFKVVYQPVLDIRTGRIVGAEALVRWVRGDGATIMPQQFIGIAEDSGLIIPLGERVLRKALEQAKAWNDAGYDMWVSVNISPRQFQDPKLVGKIFAALRESGVEPSQLGIEVTETIAMLNPESSSRILGELKSIGVRIAIDDFGTGYSSLSYLKRIPADKVKIDKSFVDGINLEADDTAIVNTILALADTLDKQVIAEGVETEEQYKALRKLKCHFAQGYWISRPVPPEDFLPLLKQRLPTFLV